MNELKIDIPKGYIIDLDNSDFDKGLIKWRKKYQNYNDIRNELKYKRDPQLAVDDSDLDKLISINKIINTARVLNEGWKPDWLDPNCSKYYIYQSGDRLEIDIAYRIVYSFAYFKSEKLAQQAIDILGKETFLKAYKEGR